MIVNVSTPQFTTYPFSLTNMFTPETIQLSVFSFSLYPMLSSSRTHTQAYRSVANIDESYEQESPLDPPILPVNISRQQPLKHSFTLISCCAITLKILVLVFMNYLKSKFTQVANFTKCPCCLFQFFSDTITVSASYFFLKNNAFGD